MNYELGMKIPQLFFLFFSHFLFHFYSLGMETKKLEFLVGFLVLTLETQPDREKKVLKQSGATTRIHFRLTKKGLKKNS